MANVRWLKRQCIWSGQIGNLHILYLWSAYHSTEKKGGVTRAQHLKQHGLDQLAENRDDFYRVKVFFT